MSGFAVMIKTLYFAQFLKTKSIIVILGCLFGCNQLFGGTGLLHFVQFELLSATNNTTGNTILKNYSKNKITKMFLKKKAILSLQYLTHVYQKL